MLHLGIVREPVAVQPNRLRPASRLATYRSVRDEPPAVVHTAGAETKPAHVAVAVQGNVVRILRRIAPCAAEAIEGAFEGIGDAADDLAIEEVGLEPIRAESLGAAHLRGSGRLVHGERM